MDRLDTISIFAAVAERGSFADAARQLNRAPASITRAVADLEEHLRVRLFNRTTRSVALTEAGERYLETARRVLSAYADMREIDGDPKAAPHGLLRVTAPVHFGRLHVLPQVVDFLGRYPAIDVRLVLLDRVVSLLDEGLDVGVRLGDLPDSSLRATRAGTIKRGIYVSPHYLDTHGTPTALHELGKHRVIGFAGGAALPDRWSFATRDGTQTVAVRPRFIVNTTEAAADAAAAGVGLVYLMSYQTAHHVASGALVEIMADYTKGDLPIHLVQPAGRFTPAKTRVFVEEIGLALRRQFDARRPCLAEGVVLGVWDGCGDRI